MKIAWGRNGDKFGGEWGGVGAGVTDWQCGAAPRSTLRGPQDERPLGPRATTRVSPYGGGVAEGMGSCLRRNDGGDERRLGRRVVGSGRGRGLGGPDSGGRVGRRPRRTRSGWRGLWGSGSRRSRGPSMARPRTFQVEPVSSSMKAPESGRKVRVWSPRRRS